MAKPELVFLTHENQQRLAAELATRQATCAHTWENGACSLCTVKQDEWEAAVKAVAAKQ